jgi:hypothetical protein
MRIQVETDISSELTSFAISGELEFNELLVFIEIHHAQSDHTKRCLWDFRSLTGGGRVSVLQMGQFYGRSGHKIAFVDSGEVEFQFEWKLA